MSSTPSPTRRRRSRLLLYFHTLKYLRLRQILHKLLFEIRFSFYRALPWLCRKRYGCPGETGCPTLTGVALLKGVLDDLPCDGASEEAAILARSDGILRNEFVFLNHAHRFEERIDWNLASASHLWRYQLQYFDYGVDLGISYRRQGARRYYLKFRDLVEDWLAQNPPGALDGWRPYTLSLRIVNWAYALELFGAALKEDQAFRRRFLWSLHRQCDFLSHHLEYQGYGNHLLANIKGLIFGGVIFSGHGPERWLRTGLQLLAQEMDEQILPDGGHFERSPMYHLQVLKDLIECRNVLERGGHPLPLELSGKIQGMVGFAEAIRMPGGAVPMTNDTARGIGPDLEEVLAMAGRPVAGRLHGKPMTLSSILGIPPSPWGPSVAPDSSVALRETGYFVLRDGPETAMVIDCGPVCPDYLPPHAHADTLSFELWIRGANLVTDSGVYEYTAGEWRDFFRSTRAHNTVVVDGEDQSEVWGSFRVARRAYPLDVVWITTKAGDYFSGGHDGYQRLAQPVLHRRRVVHVRDRFWLVLDHLAGRGRHHAESLIHFHPEAQINPSRPERISVSLHGQPLTVVPFGHDEVLSCAGQTSPIQGWHSPEFGLKQARETFRLTKSGPVPFFLGYLLIAGEASEVEVSYRLGETERYEVRLDRSRWGIDVRPAVSELGIAERKAQSAER